LRRPPRRKRVSPQIGAIKEHAYQNKRKISTTIDQDRTAAMRDVDSEVYLRDRATGGFS
jgi:hypothetical protein